MPLAQEVQNWIDQMKTAGASDDWIKSTVALMEGNEGVAKAARETVMAQSDYSRNMQALKALEKQEKDELAKTVAWQGELAKWKTGNDAEKQAAVKAREAAENRLAATRTRLATLKEQGYLDDAQLEGLDTAPAATPSTVPTPPAGPQNGNGSYLSREEGLNLGINSLRFADDLNQLRAEHNDLFKGTDHKFDRDKLIDHFQQKGGKLTDAWRALYPVDTRREELRTVAENDRVEKRAQELFQKKFSAEVMAGRPVPVAQQPSNIRRMSPIPERTDNPQKRKYDRIQRATAELESKQIPA